MKIIKSDFIGANIKIIKPAFGDAYLEIKGNGISKKCDLSEDFDEIKLVNKETNKSIRAILSFTIILAVLGLICSLIIPYAGIAFFIIWLVMFINQKSVSSNILFSLKTGEKIKAILNGNEWKFVKDYVS